MPQFANTINANGNRVTNVGTPTASADATTKAYVDAATPSPPFVYISGNILVQPSVSAATVSCSTGTLYLCPIYVPRTITITGYAFDVTTAASSGTAQVGLYSSNANGIPTTLIANSTVSGISTAATGSTTGTLATALTLTPGLYWTGLLTAVAAPTLQGHSTGLIPTNSVGTARTNGNDFFEQLSVSSLPSTLSFSLTNAFQTAPRIGLILQ
jgi:hypothetical protein